MIPDIMIPFLTVGLAELGDKTQLVIFSLAAKTTDRRSLLLGVLAAFFLLTLVAVVAGNTVAGILPSSVLKPGSGLVFILFGLLSFLNSKKQETVQPIQNPFLSSFTLILLAEMGDKSQLASGLLATRFNPILVFIGTLTALSLLSAGAVWAGQWIFSKIPGNRIHAAAGLFFIAIGLGFIFF